MHTADAVSCGPVQSDVLLRWDEKAGPLRDAIRPLRLDLDERGEPTGLVAELEEKRSKNSLTAIIAATSELAELPTWLKPRPDGQEFEDDG